MLTGLYSVNVQLFSSLLAYSAGSTRTILLIGVAHTWPSTYSGNTTLTNQLYTHKNLPFKKFDFKLVDRVDNLILLGYY